jgi:tripeptide aminopeptidase
VTATLNPEYRQKLLDRFLRYVKVDTRSDEASESSPTTEKQKDLSRMLAEELKELGCGDAEMNEWGNVVATVPGNLPADHPAAEKTPTVGLIAHVDTYFGTPGKDVKPQIIESYEGGDIELNPDQVLKPADNPNLEKCVGHTLIHTDGTTLLGADDKAGVAEIMTVIEWLKDHPEFEHGPIRIAFTTDEEVGKGADHFDVEAFGADYAYTLDGSDLGEIEDETFSADTANVTIEGHDVHPGYAKDKLVNALRVAAAIIEGIDERWLPETTEKREPYLHPYIASGDVTKVDLKVLVRAFSVEKLTEREDHLKEVIAKVEERFPKGAGLRARGGRADRRDAQAAGDPRRHRRRAAVLHGPLDTERLGRRPELPFGPRVGVARVDGGRGLGDLGDSEGVGGKISVGVRTLILER